MTRLLRLYGTICIAAFNSGCSDGPTDTPPLEGNLSIGTDKAVYSLASDSVAVTTLTNRSNRSLHLPMGDYVIYERLVDGAWVDGYSWFTVDGIGPSFPVGPMASLQDQLQLQFYLAGQPGTYRFQYLVYASRGLIHLLPLQERVSESFVVTP